MDSVEAKAEMSFPPDVQVEIIPGPGDIGVSVRAGTSAYRQSGRIMSGRDNRWLQVEVCRDYQRGDCSRSDDDCKYAHPPEHVEVNNDKVVSCFDFLKSQCTRQKCKYLHPSRRIKKEQLDSAGRNHSHSGEGHYSANRIMVNPPSFGVDPQFEFPLAQAQAHALGINGARSTGGRRADGSDRLEACREYLRGACRRPANECRYAHPSQSVVIDPTSNTVIVCMDYLKDRCTRLNPPCKYLHPPPHLQQRVRHQQQQHQATISSSGAGTAAPAAIHVPIPAHLGATPTAIPMLRGHAPPTGQLNAQGFEQVLNGMEQMKLSGPPPHMLPPVSAIVPEMPSFLPQTVPQPVHMPIRHQNMLVPRPGDPAIAAAAAAATIAAATNGFPMQHLPMGAAMPGSNNRPATQGAVAPVPQQLDSDDLASAVNIGVARQQAQSQMQFESPQMHSEPWNREDEPQHYATSSWSGVPNFGMPGVGAGVAPDWLPPQQRDPQAYEADAHRNGL